MVVHFGVLLVGLLELELLGGDLVLWLLPLRDRVSWCLYSLGDVTNAFLNLLLALYFLHTFITFVVDDGHLFEWRVLPLNRLKSLVNREHT